MCTILYDIKEKYILYTHIGTIIIIFIMIIVVLMQTKSEDEKNQQHLLYNSNNNILGSIIKKSFFSIHHIPFSSFILRVCVYVCSYVDTIIYMLLLPQNSASLFITLSSYNSLHLFII